jgi:hypothetical protein
MDYLKSGAKWYSAPKPMLLDSLFEVDLAKPTPRNDQLRQLWEPDRYK